MHIDIFWIILTIIVYFISVVYILCKRRSSQQLSRELMVARHKQSEINNFLKSFSNNLKEVETIDNSMDKTAEYVADLIGAKAICIYIVEDDFLSPAGLYGTFPPLHNVCEHVLTKRRYIMESLKQEKVHVGEGLLGEVALGNAPLYVKDAYGDPRFESSPITVDTFMAVPMVSDGQVAGVLCALNTKHGNTHFSNEQFYALKFMSTQVMLAHGIVQVYSNLTEQQRISQELDFAKQLQISLLPEHPPINDDYEIYAFTKSAKEVSGDFYDFVDIDDDRLLIVVGDACGKGIPACLLMAMTRSFIRASAERFTSLNELMVGLNNDLFRDTGDERFVTVACCLIDKKAGTLEYGRAGHTELLIGRNGIHPIREIFPDGVAFGLLPAEIAGNYDLISFTFFNDMSILLFSDGITEALNEDGEEFGLDALNEIFHKAMAQHKNPKEVVDVIINAVNEFAGDTLQADDQTVVVIKSQR